MIPDPGKVTVIKALERLTTILKLRGFLETVGFFRKYIWEFEQIAKLLNDMISIKFKNYWTQKIDEIWKEFKKRLIEISIFRHPNHLFYILT